jgi:outer membrane lipoprotein-sorting protein
MSIFSTRPALRWLVPVAVAATVIGGGAVVQTLTAAADPALPPRSAAQLLVDLQTARLDGLSGTVVQRADLGLPALPGTTTGQGSSELSSLLSGSHTLRVWYAGPDSARIALLGTLGESDIIRNGTDMWTWSSANNTATHRTLPAADAKADPKGAPEHASPDASMLPKTPQEAADAALRAIDPTTKVTTGGSARVAGRPAYELILAPRDTASLIGQVRLAIDATEHVPLRVQVYAARSDAAAFEVAFTQVSFARPDPAQFRFTPPPGAKVTEQTGQPAPGKQAPGKPDATRPDGSGPSGPPQVAVIGTGWTSVLVMRPPKDASPQPGGTANPDGRGPATTLDALPKVSGAWGTGRVLTGRLFSVLLTDDGRILAGAVPADRLYQAASDPAAALKGGG